MSLINSLKENVTQINEICFSEFSLALSNNIGTYLLELD